MRHVLIALLVSLPAPALLACPDVGYELRDLVVSTRIIALGEVAELHTVAEAEVAEVFVERALKGAPPARFYYPVSRWHGDDGDAPQAGSRVLLFLAESDDYLGTRAFWKELDRLRAGDEFFSIAYMGALLLTDDVDSIFVPALFELPETVPATVREMADAIPGWDVAAAALLAEIEALVQEEAAPIE